MQKFAVIVTVLVAIALGWIAGNVMKVAHDLTYSNAPVSSRTVAVVEGMSTLPKALEKWCDDNPNACDDVGHKRLFVDLEVAP